MAVVRCPTVIWAPALNADRRSPFRRTAPPYIATRSRQYRRAYYAAISYQDYNIGQIVGELDHLGAANTTIVITFGDHGCTLR